MMMKTIEINEKFKNQGKSEKSLLRQIAMQNLLH